MTKREKAKQRIMDVLRVRAEGPLLRDEIFRSINNGVFACSSSTLGNALNELEKEGKAQRLKAAGGLSAYVATNGVLAPPVPLEYVTPKPEPVFKSIDDEIAHTIRENEKLDEQLKVLRQLQKKKMEDSIENAKKKQELRDLLKGQKAKKEEIAQLLQTNQNLTKSV